MKCICIVVGLLFTLTSFSQDNILLSGTIKADSLQGSAVHIINLTQKTGTVNVASGAFKILVRENDTLLFSSIQYNNVQVVVTNTIIEENFITIILALDVNELAEVPLSNTKLTGNLSTDLDNIQVVKNLPLKFSPGDLKTRRYDSDLNDPLQTPLHMAAMENEIIHMGGAGANIDIIGVANLVANLVRKKSKEKPIPQGPVVLTSTQIRDLFKDDFFTSSIGIPEKSIGDFIFYLDDVGLSSQLLKDENRLALIEFLIDQGKIYNSLHYGK